VCDADAERFLEKNRDSLSRRVTTMLKATKNPLVEKNFFSTSISLSSSREPVPVGLGLGLGSNGLLGSSLPLDKLVILP
jgi:hypothetical protein